METYDGILVMRRGLRAKETDSFFLGETGKELSSFGRVAEGERTILDNASGLKDLFSPAGNRLERLKGDRTGQHSIKINDQRRIYFV